MTDWCLKNVTTGETWILHGKNTNEVARKALRSMFNIEVAVKGILSSEKVLERVGYRKAQKQITIGGSKMKVTKTIESMERDVYETFEYPSGGTVEALRQRGWIILQ
jgi:hypothetical protein